MGASAQPAGRERTTAAGVLAAATVAVGLIAGLLYAFASAVMVGLARTDDRTPIDVMQQINERRLLNQCCIVSTH